MRVWLCVAMASGCLCGQGMPRFEVASIKLRPKGSLIQMIGGGPSGARLNLEAMSLADLVSWAYDVKPWQVAGGPVWAGVQRDRTMLDENTARFDIAAKAEGDRQRTIQEYREMMQTLLAERFRLTLHRESREMPVYALVVEKGGPKFRESGPEANGVLRMPARGRIVATGGTMTQLTGWFSKANGVDRPIIDDTGLKGRYDFSLEWSMLTADASDSRPSVFQAMVEQLGLRLVPRRAPIEVLVIDSAELPGEN